MHVSSSGFGLRIFARYVVRGLRVELGQHGVVALLLLQLGDPAIRDR